MDKALQGIPRDEATVLCNCRDIRVADRCDCVGAPYLPPLARKYPRGLRRLGRLKLYTNRGVGTIFLPVRFNCPPEVTLLTLRTGSA